MLTSLCVQDPTGSNPFGQELLYSLDAMYLKQVQGNISWEVAGSIEHQINHIQTFIHWPILDKLRRLAPIDAD